MPRRPPPLCDLAALGRQAGRPELAAAFRRIKAGDLSAGARALASAACIAEIRAAAAHRDKRHDLVRLHDRQAQRLSRAMALLQALGAVAAEAEAAAALAPELALVAPAPAPPTEPEPELPLALPIGA